MFDTIFAPATPLQKSSTAIIRISGDHALKALPKLGITIQNIQPNKVYVKYIKNEKHAIIDKSIIIYFKAPKSLTGEDIVEIQCHGSLAIINFIISKLSITENFRFANRGEFLQRALKNGKMSLNQIEGLADLFDSTTEEQLKQSAMQVFCEGGNKIQEWRQSIINIYSSVVALLDFPPEDEIESQTNTNIIKAEAKKIASEIEQSIKGIEYNEKIRCGFRLTLYGETNSGKSTFINTISKRDVSIVSSIHGTTRDSIESYLNIAGYPVIITDTAGVRDNASSQVEAIGIQKTKQMLEEADIIMLLQENACKSLKLTKNLESKPIIRTLSKADSCTEKYKIIMGKKYIPFSCHKNINLEIIEQEIIQSIEKLKNNSETKIIRLRHKKALQSTLKYLDQIIKTEDLEIMSENIKMSLEFINVITGHSNFEEILDNLFSKFCIGK